MFIVFEGIDGSGTTTQSKLLCYEDDEYSWTCEPTKGPFGIRIREIFEGLFGDTLPPWRSMLMAFQADREQHREWIEAQLKEGKTVVCDRYWMSTLAYQTASALQAGESFEEVSLMIETLNKDMPEPDVTFILQVPVDEALRRKQKEPDLFEQKGFLELVNSHYNQVLGDSVHKIDTSGRSVAEVYADVLEHLEHVRKVRGSSGS